MPSQSTARRPHSSPQLREDAIAISTPKHSQSASPARFRPVAHARIREQGPSTKARFKQRKNLHQNYSGFHPKPARQPKRTASEEQLATTLSAQLQANIQDATNNFSAQIVRSANVLAENATDAVAGDIQSAVGAISDAVANTASNIEANVEGTVKQLGVDFDAQVAKYLSPRNIEKVAIGIVRNLAHVAVGAQHLIMSSEHPNDQDERDDEGDPLLPARKKPRRTGNYVNYGHWNDPHPKRHAMQTTRDKVKHFLSSKVGHYSVLTLVSLDVAGIIAAFIISLFKCKKRWGNKGWNEALSALDIAALVFSSLFMLELILSIWAFGPSYFKSKFHIVDALVVITGFALDLSLHGGAIEEAASLIVVLRLWRVFKIIEELSLGAQEQVEEMEVEIEKLRGENLALRRAGLAGKREGEIWRKELEALREEREAFETQEESEEQSPRQRPQGSSNDSKGKGKKIDKRQKDVGTDAPEEEEEEYVEGHGAQIDEELEGGDYGRRADGDESEHSEACDSKSQGEMGDSPPQEDTEKESPGPQEGIISKVTRVFVSAPSSGNEAGRETDGGKDDGSGETVSRTGSEAGLGEEDALALIREEDESGEDETGDGDGDGWKNR